MATSNNNTDISNTYDLLKFKEYLAAHQLQNLHGISAVPVVGLLGAGKSTAIGIQLGATYEESEGGYKLSSASVYTPATSSGYESKTLNVGVFKDLESKLTYLDTAGLGENRGKEAKLWTENSLNALFSAVREIKAVIVVIDFATTFGARGAGFEGLAAELFNVTRGAEVFYRSMIFVITRGFTGTGRKATEESIVQEAKMLLKQREEDERKLLQDWERRFPKTNTMTTANSSNGEETLQFDAAAVPEEDKQRLAKLKSSQKLIKEIANATGRIFVSFPKGATECRALRQNIVSCVHSSPAISRKDLLEVARTSLPSNRFVVQNILCSMASKYLAAGLANEARLLEQMAANYDSKRQRLIDVQRDWQSVKVDLISSKTRELREEKEIINKWRQESNKLSRSTKDIVVYEEQIMKERASGFLGIKSLWGAAVAEKEFVYHNSNIHFTSYECIDMSGEIRFSKEVLENLPAEGKLKLKLCSHNRKDLNVTIKIKMPENELPATKERIKVLDSLIEQRQATVIQLESNLLSLNAVTSANQLAKLITSENEKLEQEVRIYAAKFENLIHSDSKLQEKDVIKGLDSYFRLLQDTGTLHSELSEANRSSITQFLNSSQQIDRAQSNSDFHKFFPEVKTLASSNDNSRTEAVAPVPTTVQRVAAIFTPAVAMVSPSSLSSPSSVAGNASANAPALTYFRHHSPEFGTCLILWGLLISLNLSFFQILLILVGVFIVMDCVLSALRNGLTQAAQTTMIIKREFQNHLNQATDDIKRQFCFASLEAKDSFDTAVQKLTDRFKVDIKVNPKLQRLFDITGFRVFG